MKGGRFSAKNFEKCGWKTKESRILADELCQAIQEELDELLKPAFEGIVRDLNLLGHNLELYDEHPGEYHYREFFSEDRKNYKMLVALDTVVTVGYPETTDELIYDISEGRAINSESAGYSETTDEPYRSEEDNHNETDDSSFG